MNEYISVGILLGFSLICFVFFYRFMSVIKQLEEKNDCQANAVKKINSQLTDLSFIVDSLNQKIYELESDISSSTSSAEELRSSIETTRQRLVQLQEQMDSSGKEVSHALSKIESVNDATVELQTQIEKYLNIEIASSRLNYEEETPDKENAVLDQEQDYALRLMLETSSNIFITGKAGCGKSFLLERFVSTTKKRVLKLAPTGIAALNINGVTLHSAFGFKNLSKTNLSSLSLRTLSLKEENKAVLICSEVILIDEISMVRADIFDKISKILQLLCGNNLPFGGKQIVIFGDLFQLPPIADKQETQYLIDKYGGVLFFNSDAYKKAHFTFVELTVNHRQENDKPFFELLNRMREGEATSKDITLLNERSQVAPDKFTTTLFSNRADVERVNRENYDAIDGEEFCYQAEILENKYSDQTPIIDKIFPISNLLKLKVNALVMFVANDPSGAKRWVNGTRGIVYALDEKTVKVSVGRVIENSATGEKITVQDHFDVEKFEFEELSAVYRKGEIEYETILSVSQYPLVLAYAITIHKSQGMTYDSVACDVSKCFAPGQAYVAISRCRSLDGLYLRKPVKSVNIKVDQSVIEFYKSQREEEEIKSLLPDESSLFDDPRYFIEEVR